MWHLLLLLGFSWGSDLEQHLNEALHWFPDLNDKLLEELPSPDPVRLSGQELIVKKLKHVGNGFTQGLAFYKGALYESVGGWGNSALKVHNLRKHKVIRNLKFPDEDTFLEGITLLNGKLYVLTWKQREGYIYSPTLERLGAWNMTTEGWGITNDGESLIYTNGSSTVFFFSPETFGIHRTLQVNYCTKTKGCLELEQINELEYINGLIWANVWLASQVIVFSPKDGIVRMVIDFDGLYSSDEVDDVLNGIAYNGEHAYLTGKRWPSMYKINVPTISEENMRRQDYLLARHRKASILKTEGNGEAKEIGETKEEL